MKRMLRTICGILVALGMGTAAWAAPIGAPTDGSLWEFSLIEADITGTAGSTVGWGYTVTNHSLVSDLELTGFDAGSVISAVGTPVDAFFLFPVVAPGQTETVVFDEALATGLLGFQFEGTASPGDSFASVLTITATWTWDAVTALDPNADFAAGTIDAPYSATVRAADVTPVPEPGTMVLLCTGLVGLARLARRRGRTGS